MYLSMDEIGTDNVKRVIQLNQQLDRWKKIDEIASDFGFQGIQFTTNLYEREFGLSLREIPDFMGKYRCTYHIGGVYPLQSAEDIEWLDDMLKNSLEIASIYQMEDVSFHPPLIKVEKERSSTRKRLYDLVSKWAPKFFEKDITLSIETHISGCYFVFNGFTDYVDFVSSIPGLGVLIDVSHNFNDGFIIEEINSYLESCNITGLHISDAIANVDYKKGTHLPVGDGEIDFKSFIAKYSNNDKIYGALEIIAPSTAIADSLISLNHQIRSY